MICSDELFLRSQWVVYQNYQIQWINSWVDCWWISVKNDAFCMRNTLRNIQVVQTQDSNTWGLPQQSVEPGGI